ncbi:integrase core domain-containing protein [Corynebacterium striatum]|uniref:integrase core domain-containing protein n=1 Tax=Corynebacterium striatum TaxID=43770 RepID=UPI003B5AF606
MVGRIPFLPARTAENLDVYQTGVRSVEIATFKWVNWWNESRLHQSLGYRTPAEVKAEFWEHHPGRQIMDIKAKA